MECRAQGYGNGFNMSGSYKVAQARILQINPMAIFSHATCRRILSLGCKVFWYCTKIVQYI